MEEKCELSHPVLSQQEMMFVWVIVQEIADVDDVTALVDHDV